MCGILHTTFASDGSKSEMRYQLCYFTLKEYHVAEYQMCKEKFKKRKEKHQTVMVKQTDKKLSRASNKILTTKSLKRENNFCILNMNSCVPMIRLADGSFI